MSTQGWIFLAIVGFLIAFFIHRRRVARAPHADPAEKDVAGASAPVFREMEADRLDEPAAPDVINPWPEPLQAYWGVSACTS